MKRILLFSEISLHYRESLYNEFGRLFNKQGWELSVFWKRKQEQSSSAFTEISEKYSFRNSRRAVKSIDPDIVILFWNIYTVHSWLLLIWLRLKRKKVIYWSHGVSMKNPRHPLKRFLYNRAHALAGASLLYSPSELRFFRKREKFFIANNTINFNAIPEIPVTKEELKQKLGIPFPKVVLFVGRIQKRKKPEVLIRIFENTRIPNTGLVIVGAGMPEDLLQRINKNPQILYLGERLSDANEIFKASDIFCIPGTNGLGINHAMYWGLPVLTLRGFHNPEIYYLRDGETGFMLENADQLEAKIKSLLSDPELYRTLSQNARELILREASVESMFSGFTEAVRFLEAR
jgi:glycosyltransferase involved in cell wall biosynthesis